MGGSIFIRQYQRRLVVENPGGFPLGVTPENIIDRQAPRNRLIMDVLLKCGLVEKSGQGVDLMFERSIQQGKPIPDFAGTDRYSVKLTRRQVQNLLDEMRREGLANCTGKTRATLWFPGFYGQTTPKK
jgi:predicted HTH transcriptional regulator